MVLCAVDGRVEGAIWLADQVKVTAAKALLSLRADGIRLVMLTGDRRDSAQAIAE
jgi:Cu+-exporting ATPase